MFVLGVSQLTRHLVVRHTWRGAAETLVLYLPVFAVWAYTSWAATSESANCCEASSPSEGEAAIGQQSGPTGIGAGEVVMLIGESDYLSRARS